MLRFSRGCCSVNGKAVHNPDRCRCAINSSRAHRTFESDWRCIHFWVAAREVVNVRLLLLCSKLNERYASEIINWVVTNFGAVVKRLFVQKTAVLPYVFNCYSHEWRGEFVSRLRMPHFVGQYVNWVFKRLSDAIRFLFRASSPISTYIYFHAPRFTVVRSYRILKWTPTSFNCRESWESH